MPINRWVWLPVLGLVLSASCGDERFAEQMLIAQQYVRAAASGDTAKLRGIVADSLPIRFAVLVQEQEPGLFDAALHDLQVSGGSLRADTAVVEFTFPYGDTREQLGFEFIAEGGGWVVRHVQLTSRF